VSPAAPPATCARNAGSGEAFFTRQGLVEWNWPARDPLGQILTLDKFHHQRDRAVGSLQPIDGRNVGMAECSEDFGFALDLARRSASPATDAGRTLIATARFRFVSVAR
jgi:hypothetical protein